MSRVPTFHRQQQIDARRNLAEFIRRCREELTPPSDQAGFDWHSPIWPGVWWVKVIVGKRRRITDDERLDPGFVDFAKAYYRWRGTERTIRWEVQALRCIESALLTRTGSGSIEGLMWAVLDESAVVARKHFSPAVRYHVGRGIRDIARFVSVKRLVLAELSTWQSPFARVSSVQRTGRAGRAEARSKLPSEAGLHAMAEIFANDPVDPQVRFVSAVWALLLSAPWRIGEILMLHVDAEHEATDDKGVLSYGLRYYGEKGFGHDIKWVSQAMEPVAREAFRRIREMTESARALARHLETSRETPFLHPDASEVGVDDELTFEERAAYLRRPVPESDWRYLPEWNFLTIREHWERVRDKLPTGFPVFARATGLKWSEALFCFHRSVLHKNLPADFYGLAAPTTNTVNGLLGSQRTKQGVAVLAKLGYQEPDGSPIRLNTHQARHFVSTLAERGSMAQEDLAKWAGRALTRDNRTYNHMTESERAGRARSALQGTALAGGVSAPARLPPTTPQDYNRGTSAPTQRTEFGVCEHDWVMSPCMKNRDCLNCSEHVCVKGDVQAHVRVQVRYEHNLAECTKALDAVRSGAAVADRWLEHALKSLIREQQLLALMESEEIEDGTQIRLSEASAEHSHLRRALDQRLPKLRDRSLPKAIRALIGRYASGKPLVDGAD